MGYFKYIASAYPAVSASVYSGADTFVNNPSESLYSNSIFTDSVTKDARKAAEKIEASTKDKNDKRDDKVEKSDKKKKYTPSSLGLQNAKKAQRAFYGMGTDEKAIYEICEGLDEDKVMDLMLSWNKLCSAQHGESFMKAFFNDMETEAGGLNSAIFGVLGMPFDYDNFQKTKKCMSQIADALASKALQLGIYDELASEFGKIDSEIGSYAFIDKSIAYRYDLIIAKIAEKMNVGNGLPNKKA